MAHDLPTSGAAAWRRAGGRRETADLAAIVLAVAAAAQVLPGLLAFLAPGAFYDAIAPYPPENHHILRDVGSWQIALGIAALLAVRNRAWRVPMLAILTLQFALHTVSHVIDVDHADPSWVGPAELVALAAGTVVFAAVMLKEARP